MYYVWVYATPHMWKSEEKLVEWVLSLCSGDLTWGVRLWWWVLLFVFTETLQKYFLYPNSVVPHSLRESVWPLYREETGLREVNALNQCAEETSAQGFWLDPLWPLSNTYSLCSCLDFPFYFILHGHSANWQLPNSLNRAILFSFLLFLLTDLHYETQTCNQLVNLLPQLLSANDRIAGVVLHARFPVWFLLTKNQKD